MLNINKQGPSTIKRLRSAIIRNKEKESFYKPNEFIFLSICRYFCNLAPQKLSFSFESTDIRFAETSVFSKNSHFNVYTLYNMSTNS